ncbi:hypothetical protein GCM10007315_35220 [Gemmobacter tilapiae]|uniref:Uncharacterized protein n=1 Tax=Neogemmobacter tilapiae TaxID=875041 RepID=A0A918WRC5_9RHOB|nr:hypothetical protein GCM10007315_35220 [Gemmobacter tilapiae]
MHLPVLQGLRQTFDLQMILAGVDGTRHVDGQQKGRFTGHSGQGAQGQKGGKGAHGPDWGGRGFRSSGLKGPGMARAAPTMVKR